MTNPFGFDVLKGILHRQLAPLPDHRQKGPNTQYAIQDAALGPLAAFSPNHPRFWSISVGCNTPKGTITPRPCWASSRFPVTIRSARCSIRSRRAISMRCLWRSLRAWNSAACWHTFGSLATNCWWRWMVPTTSRRRPFIAPTVSPVN